MPRNKQRRPQPGLGAVEGRSVVDGDSAAPMGDELLADDGIDIEEYNDVAGKASHGSRKRRCVA